MDKNFYFRVEAIQSSLIKNRIVYDNEYKKLVRAIVVMIIRRYSYNVSSSWSSGRAWSVYLVSSRSWWTWFNSRSMSWHSW